MTDVTKLRLHDIAEMLEAATENPLDGFQAFEVWLGMLKYLNNTTEPKDAELAGEYLLVTVEAVIAEWVDTRWPVYETTISVHGLQTHECYHEFNFSVVAQGLEPCNIMANLLEASLNNSIFLREYVRGCLDEFGLALKCTMCDFQCTNYTDFVAHDLDEHPETLPPGATDSPVDKN